MLSHHDTCVHQMMYHLDYIRLLCFFPCDQVVDTAAGNLVVDEQAHGGASVWASAMRPDGKGDDACPSLPPSIL